VRAILRDFQSPVFLTVLKSCHVEALKWLNSLYHQGTHHGEKANLAGHVWW